MPGFGNRIYLDSRGKSPWALKTSFTLLIANFVGSFSVTSWAENYAPHQVSATDTFPIHFKGGLVVFVRPWLGLYEHWSFWLNFLFLGLFGLLFWVCASKAHEEEGLDKVREGRGSPCPGGGGRSKDWGTRQFGLDFGRKKSGGSVVAEMVQSGKAPQPKEGLSGAPGTACPVEGGRSRPSLRPG
jgi:hypothetical protein